MTSQCGSTRSPANTNRSLTPCLDGAWTHFPHMPSCCCIHVWSMEPFHRLSTVASAFPLHVSPYALLTKEGHASLNTCVDLLLACVIRHLYEMTVDFHPTDIDFTKIVCAVIFLLPACVFCGGTCVCLMTFNWCIFTSNLFIYSTALKWECKASCCVWQIYAFAYNCLQCFVVITWLAYWNSSLHYAWQWGGM